jgi:Ca-activated chloride channel family protein
MPFRSLRFLEPDAAYWLLALPLLWSCWLLHRWYRERRRRVSGIGPRLARLAPLTGLKRDLAVLAMVTIGGAALVSAAARPQAIVRAPQHDPIDLILLLDRSASMLATDVKPSRFGRACLEIGNFLTDKPDTIARVGLIAFSGTAIVTSHLTRDLDILSFFLDWMKDDRHPFYGTDLATVLESALGVARTESPQHRTVVVLVSDGEDHGERLERAIDEFRTSGIPIYAIGVGGDEAVTIPAPRGSDEPTLRDENGDEITTTFNEATLRRVATMTNGRYFRSTTGLELATTLAEVAARETRTIQFREEYRDVDSFALATAAVVLSGLLVLL